MPKICIIDYKSGNIQSIKAALDILNISYVVSNQNEKINECSHLILPGVGSYKSAMLKLNNNINVQNLSNQVLKKKKPILGICVGMQIFSSYGYEFSKCEGLNWIPGTVEKLETNFTLPHIGWNTVQIVKDNELFLNQDSEFYFLNTFSFKCKNENHILGKTLYEKEFLSIINKDNIYGVQFHPEKSQVNGLNLLKNFAMKI
jgi:imidazole glycerol-phosphate synthase subunit HisH